MNRQWILACFLVLLCPGLGLTGEWQGKVVKVLDGDSLRVARGNQVDELRLYGIDTPEFGQPFSDMAKKYTRGMVQGKIVRVTAKDVDRYQRTVSLVEVRGRLVNRELVRDGWAWVSRKYCQETKLCEELKKLEGAAKAAHRGLWRSANPVPPWEWKRRHKKAH